MGVNGESSSLKLVVGLGNPGGQYVGTRHNVGFEVVFELVRRWQAGKSQLKFQAEYWEAFSGGRRILLATPLTFMNNSGEAVQQMARFFQIQPQEIVVVTDDMNLPSGQLRWRAFGSAGGQKGLSDIMRRLGTEQVPRLRIGIGRPPGQMDATSWVLGKFRSEERPEAELAMKVAADSVEMCAIEGLVATMNRYNRNADSGG